ncbi:hypothetical protein ACKS0A_09084 [Histoplasma ohiense]
MGKVLLNAHASKNKSKSFTYRGDSSESSPPKVAPRKALPALSRVYILNQCFISKASPPCRSILATIFFTEFRNSGSMSSRCCFENAWFNNRRRSLCAAGSDKCKTPGRPIVIYIGALRNRVPVP